MMRSKRHVKKTRTGALYRNRKKSELNNDLHFCTNYQSPVKFLANHTIYTRDSYTNLSKEEKHKLKIGLRDEIKWNEKGGAFQYYKDWWDYPPDITLVEMDADDIKSIKFIERKRPHAIGTIQHKKDPTFLELPRPKGRGFLSQFVVKYWTSTNNKWKMD